MVRKPRPAASVENDPKEDIEQKGNFAPARLHGKIRSLLDVGRSCHVRGGLVMNHRDVLTLVITLLVASVGTTASAQDAPKMKMTTDIPRSITTPTSVETRIGTLKFF